MTLCEKYEIYYIFFSCEVKFAETLRFPQKFPLFWWARGFFLNLKFLVLPWTTYLRRPIPLTKVANPKISELRRLCCSTLSVSTWGKAFLEKISGVFCCALLSAGQPLPDLYVGLVGLRQPHPVHLDEPEVGQTSRTLVLLKGPNHLFHRGSFASARQAWNCTIISLWTIFEVRRLEGNWYVRYNSPICSECQT